VKINDSRLWPADLGPLRFVAQGASADCDVFVIADDDTKLATLTARADTRSTAVGDADALVVNSGFELVMPARGSTPSARWLLSRPGGVTSGALSDDVIAWVTLTILSQLGGRAPGRG
jgi:hypothetical protein